MSITQDRPETTPKKTGPTSEPLPPSNRLLGLVCGLAAAVGYTLANMALRQSARPADLDWSIWVTAHKAVPAALLGWLLVYRNYARGKVCFPPRGLVLPLILTGCAMQFGGNMTFQYSLSLIGLAMSVPITFSLILTSGAIFSRIYLKEPITIRTLVALGILIIAVSVLSLGAGEASRDILADASLGQIVLGVCMSLTAGTGYGVCGVVIRRNVKNLPVSATLVLISTTGLVGMTAVGLLRLTPEEILGTTWQETGIMLLAGVFNAGAFYSIGTAFRHLNVTQVNMINTTQIAMATCAGVLFFSEPMTGWLIGGVLLTIVGLFTMDRD